VSNYDSGGAASLAGLPKELIENPSDLNADRQAGDNDVLSDVLRNVRLSGSLQFCFMPTGTWQTDATPSLANMANRPSTTMPFHIVVEGTCWLKMEGRESILVAGDIVAFPFGTGHQLGAGAGGRLITPVKDLPPKPWRELPALHYGEERQRVRLLCGYLQCDAINFRPLRNALPSLLHVRTRGTDDAGWLRATIGQIVAEVDRPRVGGLAMLERLTEISFIELLRHQIIAAQPGSAGWLAALADPSLGRCLSLIHDDPERAWSLHDLSAASGLSRSTLSERFETMLDTSPMRYVRDWRLCLASVALSTTAKGIAAGAHDAGYGTEAAFNRAFSRTYGAPPAAWRQNARQGQPR
jgi:AraC-like DNA-binding protein/mannose-6-phosphate isomerase-like protein (cupin superfamily)